MMYSAVFLTNFYMHLYQLKMLFPLSDCSYMYHNFMTSSDYGVQQRKFLLEVTLLA